MTSPRPVRVAVIDSGVHASHPHVCGVGGGIGIDQDGAIHQDYVDRLGHGTAVAAAIREKAPAADIFAIKIFDRELAATAAALVAAWSVSLDWSVPRESCWLDRLDSSGGAFRASGFPRPIPGVPAEKNVKGLSFAVANVTGIVAKILADDRTGDAVGAVTRAFAKGG
jgi:subtilisin family serine protease